MNGLGRKISISLIHRYRRYFIDENIDIVSISKMGYRPITSTAVLGQGGPCTCRSVDFSDANQTSIISQIKKTHCLFPSCIQVNGKRNDLYFFYQAHRLLGNRHTATCAPYAIFEPQAAIENRKSSGATKEPRRARDRTPLRRGKL
jgi:hypothetical protein